MNGEFDRIIVGAGSAGCVLASRLSEDPTCRVLLVEDGPDDDKREIAIPAGWPSLFKTEVDWGYHTESEPRLANRQVFFPRGRTLGGSSSINAQIYLRGAPVDFDEWAELGNPGWGWEDLLPVFRRSENNQRGADPWHGGNGPLRVEDARYVSPMTRAFVAAGLELGLLHNPDFNGAGLEGIGPLQFTRHRGRRCSTARAFLHPARGRSNLTVWSGRAVERLEIESGQVVGVSVKCGGRPKLFRARDQVILCAGAIGSPALLLRSGIGPGQTLQSLGISVILDSPGVGQNLQDHVLTPLRYRTPGTRSLIAARSLTELLKFLLMGRGMLSSCGAEAAAHVRLKPDDPAPDLQLLIATLLWLDEGLTEPDEHGFTLVAAAMKPLSRGFLELSSPHAEDPPRIRPGYLTDPEGVDLDTLRAGLRWCGRLAASRAMTALAPQVMDLDPATASDHQLDAHIARHGQTYYHPVGTCAMGPQGVVDARLQVRGIGGLRIADASIMPTIPRANTNAATVAVAEKAADLIRGR